MVNFLGVRFFGLKLGCIFLSLLLSYIIIFPLSDAQGNTQSGEVVIIFPPLIDIEVSNENYNNENVNKLNQNYYFNTTLKFKTYDDLNIESCKITVTDSVDNVTLNYVEYNLSSNELEKINGFSIEDLFDLFGIDRNEVLSERLSKVIEKRISIEFTDLGLHYLDFGWVCGYSIKKYPDIGLRMISQSDQSGYKRLEFIIGTPENIQIIKELNENVNKSEEIINILTDEIEDAKRREKENYNLAVIGILSGIVSSLLFFFLERSLSEKNTKRIIRKFNQLLKE